MSFHLILVFSSHFCLECFTLKSYCWISYFNSSIELHWSPSIHLSNISSSLQELVNFSNEHFLFLQARHCVSSWPQWKFARGFLWVKGDSEDGFREDGFFTTPFLEKLYNTTIQLRWIFSSVVRALKKKTNPKQTTPQKDLYQIV